MEIVRPRPRVLALGALFIAYHVAATLTNTAPDAVRAPLWPLFADYGDGLRLTGRFGVFARFTADTSVAVYGTEAGGKRHLLSHSSPARRRAEDARITKIQRRFRSEDTRKQLGLSYLAYFCRIAAHGGLPIVRVELELEHTGEQPRSEIVLLRRCEGTK